MASAATTTSSQFQLSGSATLAAPVLVAARASGLTASFTADDSVRDAMGAPALRLVTDDGVDITSAGSAVLRYVVRVNGTLEGHGAGEKAQVDCWTDVAYQRLLTPKVLAAVGSNRAVLQSLVNMGINHSSFQQRARTAVGKLDDLFGQLNDHFQRHTFVVGHTMTMADIALAAGAGDILALLLSPQKRGYYCNIVRWFRTVAANPSFAVEMPGLEFVGSRAGSAIDKAPEPAVVAALADASVAANAGLKKAKTQRDMEKEKRAKADAAKKEKSASSSGAGGGAGGGAGAVAPGDQVVGGVEATDAQPESNLTDKDLPIDEKIAKAEAALKSIGIEYATIDDLLAVGGDIAGALCKNLFLKPKKGRKSGDTRLWLVVALHDTKTDMKFIGTALGYKKNANVRFGDNVSLERNLGVIQGSVTPFALINDTALKVNVALDSRLLAQKTLAFHPLTNEASTTITPADLLKFINATGHTYEVIDFDA